MSCAPGRSWTWSSGKDSRPRPDGTAAPAASGSSRQAGGSTGGGSTAAGSTGGGSGGGSSGGTAQQPPGAGPAGGAAGGFAGRVTLTVPLGTAAGLADRPGELGGHGPVDPWLARDLVNAAAASPKTTWCVTVTDQHGHAVGHGCARPEPKSHQETRRTPAGRRAGPGSASPRPAGTGRPADTAPGGCAHRAAGRT